MGLTAVGSNQKSNQVSSPLDTKSKWMIAALAVVAAASAVLLGLGASDFFGNVGSLNFFATVAGGGAGVLLCVGLIAYIVLKARSNSPATGSSKSGHVRSQAGTSSQARKVEPYSQLALKTIQHARSLIKPDTASASLNGNQPTNPEIAKLVTLYYAAWTKFFEALKKHPDPWSQQPQVLAIINEEFGKAFKGQNSSYNPWSSKTTVDAIERRVLPLVAPSRDPWTQLEVCEAADELMTLGFTISALTLDDLPKFTEKMTTRKTYVQSLARQDSYMYKTFYNCPTVYHLLRGRMVCQDPAGKGRFDYLPGRYIPRWHQDFFNAQVSYANTWLKLHNEYSDRVRQYVDETELEREDPRHVNWSRRDDGTSNFRIEPDTQPT